MKMRVRIPWRKRQRQTDNVDPDVAVLRLRGGFELEADGGAICCMIIAFIVVEIIFFLFQPLHKTSVVERVQRTMCSSG